MDAEFRLDPAINVQALTRPHAPYPYLVVRLMPAVFGICPLTTGLSRERLIQIAQQENAAHRGDLKVCLVLGDQEALYVGVNDQMHRGKRPWGGRTVDWPLAMATYASSSARH